MNDDLPKETIRAMGAVLVAIFYIALDGTRDVLEQLQPLVEPPEDLRVTGSMGVVYNGVVVIERNAVIAGIVIEVGRTTTSSPAREPLITPPSRYDDRGRFERRDEREGRLPGWGEDPRSTDMFDEDGRWRR